MRSIGIYSTVILLFAVRPTWAIVNIEAVRQAELKPGVDGEVGLAMGAIDSSTDERRLDIDGRIDWLHRGKHDFVVTQGVVSEVEGVERRRVLLHLRHVQALGQGAGDSPYGVPHNWELFAQAARDDYSALQERSLAGTGLRWNRPFSALQDHALGLGVMSEWLQVENDGGEEKTQVWRANLYLTLRATWQKSFSIASTTYFQPRLGEWDDFGAIEELSLDFEFSERLSLRFLAAAVHDSDPPAGVLTNREEYGFRIVYRFRDGK